MDGLNRFFETPASQEALKVDASVILKRLD
jgi:hypothetical protein